jgi:phosphate/sulfate permease
LIGGFAGAFLAAFGWEAVRGGVVGATAIFIVVAPITGMIMAYLISVWFLNSFRKGPWMKLLSLSIIAGTCWLVWNSLEFKKDFNGATSYTLVFQQKVDKDKLKSALKFTDENLKEYSPVVKAGKDSTGAEDKTGTIFMVRTDYMKKVGDTAVNTNLTAAIDEGLATVKTAYLIQDAHKITEASDEKERFDDSNLKSDFQTYWLKVIFHGSNFKWILLGFIVVVIGFFTLFLSSLNNSRANHWFKRLQLFSSAAFSVGHGGNDAQKVMGIITVALIANGNITSMKEMPTWVPLACYAAIAIGTMSGGWKIVKTMGTKITKVTPFEGVAAETAGAITLFLTEAMKIPVSTTHTITGSIIGVGATKRLSAVRWGVTVNLLWAWILTIPISGLLAALFYVIVHYFYPHL